ncbi:MAG TPA: 50S ribosomal protein L6 [Candidatus Nitrosocosmicus sp.]|nr:50S ribosomal protein L6 [Candidatus Nitrosocosmicus sp.]
MSKIGERPITIESDVQIDLQDEHIKVTGKEGSLEVNVPSSIKIEKNEGSLLIKRKDDSKHNKAMHGLIRSLIQNAVTGVNKTWQKRLEVVGTGYRVKAVGTDLSFEVGYSHPVVFKNVEGIKLVVEGNNKVVVSGIDRQLVGQVAAQIKAIKKPDPYKGKGMRYEGEVIKLKAGKKAKTAGAK